MATVLQNGMALADEPSLQAALASRISYDPATGLFVDKATGREKIVRLNENSAPTIRLKHAGRQRDISAFAAAWFLSRGVVPETPLGPANGDPLDFRAANIRPARTARGAGWTRAQKETRARERSERKTHTLEQRLQADWQYDPDTGALTNKRTGRKAEAQNDGYVVLSVKSRSVAAHRAAFFLMLGRWPAGVVDHVNGDRADNRWTNLRETTVRENNANVPHLVGRQVVRIHGRYAPIVATFERYEDALAALELL